MLESCPLCAVDVERDNMIQCPLCGEWFCGECSHPANHYCELDGI